MLYFFQIICVYGGVSNWKLISLSYLKELALENPHREFTSPVVNDSQTIFSVSVGRSGLNVPFQHVQSMHFE